MAFLDETGLSHLMQKIKDADNELNKKIPQPSTENPKPLGVTATSGTSETWARADHVHKRPVLSAGNSATEGEFYQERLFRDRVLYFFYSDKEKLLRSTTEGNKIVRLTIVVTCPLH